MDGKMIVTMSNIYILIKKSRNISKQAFGITPLSSLTINIFSNTRTLASSSTVLSGKDLLYI